ncbi:hypothetical protein [Burkholderia sp. MSMB1835]|uniref:hypothetical protein n=1 Tax=Burkholderia sp. MSMB1835 TaxID=1637876 RepID=UPI0007578FA8|nr:hypothetical protein [Burkholderia sp. MSMB1835]KVL40948.1 hypothetical protein WS96_02700 [Burkholderia sp. MSMB1835]
MTDKESGNSIYAIAIGFRHLDRQFIIRAIFNLEIIEPEIKTVIFEIDSAHFSGSLFGRADDTAAHLRCPCDKPTRTARNPTFDAVVDI